MGSLTRRALANTAALEHLLRNQRRDVMVFGKKACPPLPCRSVDTHGKVSGATTDERSARLGERETARNHRFCEPSDALHSGKKWQIDN